VIYDALERCYTVAAANFVTDLTALAAAKGITVVTSCNFVKRQTAEEINRLQGTLPACGIYALNAQTQGRDQTKRDSLISVVFDYYAEDTDPLKVSKQVELAAEVLVKVADQLPNSLTYGGGVLPGSITVQLSRGFTEADQTNWWRRAIVTMPVWDRDSGL
jgi:hypothetical protein